MASYVFMVISGGHSKLWRVLWNMGQSEKTLGKLEWLMPVLTLDGEGPGTAVLYPEGTGDS